MKYKENNTSAVLESWTHLFKWCDRNTSSRGTAHDLGANH